MLYFYVIGYIPQKRCKDTKKNFLFPILWDALFT